MTTAQSTDFATSMPASAAQPESAAQSAPASAAQPTPTDACERAALVADIDDIYLGNLGTVEADLDLPTVGKRGSAFTWTSGERLFLADDGRITRPTFGVGDRDITLSLTATRGSLSERRDYTVTVLQEQPVTVITAADDVELTVFAGQPVTLPSVAIVHLSDGAVEVRPVEWRRNEPSASPALPVSSASPVSAAQPEPSASPAQPEPSASPASPEPSRRSGETIDYATGRIEGWDGEVHARVTFVLTHPTAAERNRAQASRDAFVRSHATLHGDGPLAAKVAARLRFLAEADLDRMLVNFRQAAGLDTRGAEPMTGWDNPDGNLRGHTTGHFLSALALAYSCTGEETLRERIETMTTALAQCQRALHEDRGYSRGFLSGYGEEQFDLLEQYVTYPTIWAPYYTFDKIVSGLLDCYEYAGSVQALDIALNMGLWVNNRLGRLTKAQRDRMWSIYIAGEYGGIISALIRLHRITGDARFVTTAGYFHNDKLLYPMLRGEDTLGGMHGNQHIPQIIGALDCACHGGDLDGLTVARHFWSMLTAHHMYANGGTGETEMFRAPDAIAVYLTDKSAESCTAYNLSKLAMRLFETSPQAGYVDYYENALFNDLLPATHGWTAAAPTAAAPAGTAPADAASLAAPLVSDGGTAYFFPTRPGGRLSFDTDENTCCHGTGFENMFRFEEHIVKGTRDTAYVNLYLPARAEACEGAFRCAIRRAGGAYDTAYLIDVDECRDVRMLLRRPAWATSMSMRVNGMPVGVHEVREPGYVACDRPVGRGDVVEVVFGAGLRLVGAPDDPSVAAVAYGPWLLAAFDERETFIELDRHTLETAEPRSMDEALAALAAAEVTAATVATVATVAAEDAAATAAVATAATAEGGDGAAATAAVAATAATEGVAATAAVEGSEGSRVPDSVAAHPVAFRPLETVDDERYHLYMRLV